MWCYNRLFVVQLANPNRLTVNRSKHFCGVKRRMGVRLSAYMKALTMFLVNLLATCLFICGGPVLAKNCTPRHTGLAERLYATAILEITVTKIIDYQIIGPPVSYVLLACYLLVCVLQIHVN